MKKGNEYQNILSAEFFNNCPKSVLAAIAVSYLLNQGVSESEVEASLLSEWRTLHENGIVPQKPKK